LLRTLQRISGSLKDALGEGPDSSAAPTKRIGACRKEYLMNRLKRVRVASVVAVALATFGAIGQVADFAYPLTPVARVSVASR
jgi:hypothetical protein